MVRLKYDSSSGKLLSSCEPVKPICYVLPKYNGYIHGMDIPFQKGKTGTKKEQIPYKSQT